MPQLVMRRRTCVVIPADRSPTREMAPGDSAAMAHLAAAAWNGEIPG